MFSSQLNFSTPSPIKIFNVQCSDLKNFATFWPSASNCKFFSILETKYNKLILLLHKDNIIYFIRKLQNTFKPNWDSETMFVILEV